MNQDQGVVDLGFHAIRIGYEVRREIAAVKLHAFHDFKCGLKAFSLFNRDHSLFADLLHRFGDRVADFAVGVGGD